MCYYGLTSAAATLTADLYLNFTLVILVEVRWRGFTVPRYPPTSPCSWCWTGGGGSQCWE